MKFLVPLVFFLLLSMLSSGQLQKVVPHDRTEDDWFGFAARIDGNYAIAAAPVKPYIKDGDTVKGIGKVYVFKQTKGNWKEITDISKADFKKNDLFGYGISKGIDIQGRRIAIGAHGDDNTESDDMQIRMGAVYIYIIGKDDKAYLDQKIMLPERSRKDWFGTQVHLEGDFLIVCSGGSDDAVYVYKLKQEQYAFIQKIYNVNQGKTVFGPEASISGHTLMISSIDRVNTYEYNATSKKFVPDQRIDLPKTHASMTFESISVDKKTMAVGLNGERYTYCDQQGFKGDSIYMLLVLKEDSLGQSKWERIYLSNSDKDSPYFKQAKFNASATPFLPWKTYTQKAMNAGAVLIYKKKKGKWKLAQTIQANKPITDAHFGMCVSLEGKNLAIGAYNERIDPSVCEESKGVAGSAFLFQANRKGQFIQVKKFTPKNRVPWDKFGFSVEVNGKHLIIGSRFESEDENEQNPLHGAGAIYFYQIAD